jgi:lysophospholipase L1-like esterase
MSDRPWRRVNVPHQALRHALQQLCPFSHLLARGFLAGMLTAGPALASRWPDQGRHEAWFHPRPWAGLHARESIPRSWTVRPWHRLGAHAPGWRASDWRVSDGHAPARRAAHGREGHAPRHLLAIATAPRRAVLAEPLPPPADPRLLSFYRALEAIESGRRRDPVVVLQIGDSHTANDSFSGRLRELFQRRFGAGGRGVLPAGIPYPYFRPAGVQVSATGWDRLGGKPTGPGADPPPPALIGLAATRMHSAGPAEMTYTVDDPADLRRVAIEIVQQPGGGMLSVAYDGRPAWLLGTAGEHPPGRAVWVALPPTGGAHTMTLRAHGDGPVDLLAVDLRRAQPGVIWANLGTVGATVSQVASWDPAVVAADLAHLHPDLIVLAFGTNEGFATSLDEAAYQASFEHAARLLAQTGAPLAVIEPPDGNRRAAAGPGVTASAAAAYVPAGPIWPVCGPALDESGRPAGVWEEPAALAVVRRAQAAVAARHNWFAWDWATAMGGPCGMARWAAATPPLAYPDHVHLREAGARQTAEALFSALMSGYARLAAAHGP